MSIRSIDPMAIKRVVVRGANWVGDAVMTIPALRELRRLFPQSHITLATREWARDIFDDADFVDEILVTKHAGNSLFSIFGQTRTWRQKGFDLSVIFPNSFEPTLIAFTARVPIRVGYATQGRSLLLTHPIAVPEWRGARHESTYYTNLVGEIERLISGVPTTEQRELRTRIDVAPEKTRVARENLALRGIDVHRPIVALCPGSTNSRAKRWPIERYARLADLLTDDGSSVILIGANDERDISDAVAEKARGRVFNLTGETKLAETIAILSVCDLLITNDTGPAHIAAAVDCPVVVIFGPTNPITTRPYSDSAVIVRHPPDCAPCMLRDCPIDHRCMTAISPEEVFAQSLTLLSQRNTPEAVR